MCARTSVHKNSALLSALFLCMICTCVACAAVRSPWIREAVSCPVSSLYPAFASGLSSCACLCTLENMLRLGLGDKWRRSAFFRPLHFYYCRTCVHCCILATRVSVFAPQRLGNTPPSVAQDC